MSKAAARALANSAPTGIGWRDSDFPIHPSARRIMSSNGKPGRQPYRNRKRNAPCEPGDEQAAYTVEALLAMNEKFCAALERANRRRRCENSWPLQVLFDFV